MCALLTLGACQEFSAEGAAGGAGEGGIKDQQGGGAAGRVQSSAGEGGGRSEAGSGMGGSAGEAQAGSAGSAGSPSEAGAAGNAPSDCPCAAPTPSCVGGKCVSRGPQMAKVTSFYIDRTEVTAAQYALFQANVSATPQAQVNECAWNDTFEPLFLQGVTPPLPNEPVTSVDYCDAAAFCSWADKRLCGRIGGGELAFPELADPTKSQWYLACAGPMAQKFPYGVQYQSGACNDQSGKGKLGAVASSEACAGYYPGLFDMVGNAQEWTSACNAKVGPDDGCERMGGSYQDKPECSTSGLAKRSLQLPELGFRCCSK